jgi:hypothetical protein
MRRRIPRSWKPAVERVERRELLSLVTNIMAGNHQALISSKTRIAFAHVSNSSANSTAPIAPMVAQMVAGGGGSGSAGASGSSRSAFVPSTTSIALPQNQGYLPPANPGYNLILQPTGTATRAEVKRQLFTAVYRGPYLIAPGSYSSQAQQVFFRGDGSANTMLHSDIQMRLAIPSDPLLQTTGASTIFDRNLNSNTVLGLDLATPRTNVDNRGRPNHITSVTLDVNASAGVYDEAFAQGVMDIHYYPSAKKIPGATEQGTAIVKIHAQIYSGLVAFILRNSDINP